MTSSIKISNIKCTELVNVEKKGSIDPYVIIKFKDITRETNRKNKELNPTYDGALLEFDLSGNEVQADDSLEILVKDHETFHTDRVVGKCTISLSPFCEVGVTSQEFNEVLNNENGEATKGKISFQADYQPPAGSGNAQDVDADNAGNLESEILPDGTPNLKKAPKKRTHNLPDKLTDFQFRIKIIKGCQIVGDDIHPTVRIKVGDELKQTRVKTITNKPFYDETFFFNFNERPNVLFNKIVTIEVYDANKVMHDSLLGTFQCDLGTFYFENDHAIIRKWLLMTTPEESEDDESKGASARPGGPPAGYVKITGFILGPGNEIPDAARGDTSQHDDDDDVEANLLRPASVALRPATFLLKIYKADDLPQMDPSTFDSLKKLFGTAKSSEHCDPYAKFSFAGQTVHSKIMKGSENPEFNQELRVSFKFPSMCERLKLQFFDWDSVGNDDCIGTTFISMSSISGTGDNGFLPSFGPSYVNMYGSLREFSNIVDEHDALNKGIGNGVAYRGRALIEISTQFGNKVTKSVDKIQPKELVRVMPYLRRKKYKLFAAFLSANMIAELDDPVEFEISIGNYGNKLDSSVEPQSSCTPPTNPVFDGNNYYYLPWGESKPCCIVESHWEDIAFRLEPLNILLKIEYKLQKNIKNVELAIKAKLQPPEKATLLIELLDQFISDCKIPFPKFNASLNGVNKLDLRQQDIRRDELATLCKAAESLREQATDIDAALEVINGYLSKIKDLCVEPQNSLPDVIISMISGNERIAYYRIPAYEVLNSLNPNASGKNCGRLQNIIMRYPGDKGSNTEKHPEIPASVSVVIWLGFQKDESNFIAKADEEKARFSSYAEMYENQIFALIFKWTTTGSPRPEFSDIKGDRHLRKESFVPPEGWKWDKDWFVHPELSANFDADAGHTKFLQDIFENESRVLAGNWKASTIPYTNLQGEVVEHRDKMEVPKGWKWIDDWVVDNNRACDEEGWEYCVTPDLGGWASVMRSYHLFRRRRLVRNRELQEDLKLLQKQQKEQARLGEGWEYAPTFGKKYHLKEKKSDMVRRRRWHRKMVNTIPGKEPIFTIPNDDKDKPPIQFMPRRFFAFEESHNWQLRCYIYQARNLLGLDSEGVSDPYACVCFQTVSKTTRVVWQTISPEWDQTLIFESLSMFGSPELIADNPPFIFIELFDKDNIGKDEFMGRVSVQPMVKLEGPKPPVPRLLWLPIMQGDRQCGELLAAFELFLDEGADLPLPPPMEENRFIVPTGIRPVLVRTAFETLLWGVRSMKKYQLASCTSPSVSVEIAGHIIESNVIKTTKKNPNFTNNAHFKELYLPKEPLYMPPIIIKVRDHRTFGRKPVVGHHIINCITLSPPPKLEEMKKVTATSDSVESTEVDDDATIDVEDDDEENKKTKLKKKEKKVFERLDWWSKYYASIGQEKKCGEFLTKNYKVIQIYRKELEEVEEFGGFKDFVETFPLERGKDTDDEIDNVVGEFKGVFKIYPLPQDPNEPSNNARYFPKAINSKPIKCIVRVYIIRGIQLQPKDPNGKADPFIVLELGKKKISDKDNYIPNEINPIFGAYFEMKAQIPIEKELKIRVMDYDLIGSNELIGETAIDLENRFYSKARATVGLPPDYFTSGPYKWRDSKSPREILERICKTKPQFISDTEVAVNDEMFKLGDYEPHALTDPNLGPSDERLALHILNNKKFEGQKIVPEHVETRSLKNPLQPGMDQGQLEMFVDIFPLPLGPPGPPFNISPRLPQGYTLRVIVWDTLDVPPDETSITGEEVSDMYIKGWMEEDEDNMLESDVHYNCTGGEGMFNWRMCFPIKYMPEEQVMVLEKKEHGWSLDTTKQLLPPTFNIQAWDADLFENDYLGHLELTLNKLPRPTKKASSCKKELLQSHDTIDLFKVKTQKGWWPMVSITSAPDGSEVVETKGKIELSLEILTDKEAELKPAGQGRDEPNANPELIAPNRPMTTMSFFTSPWKTFTYLIWKNYKWHIIGFFVFVFLLLFIGLILYNVPGNIVQSLFGN